MFVNKLFIRKEMSKVFALCQTPKGIYTVGEYRSIKKAKARCNQLAKVMNNSVYIGIFENHEWQRERRVLSGKEPYHSTDLLREL